MDYRSTNKPSNYSEWPFPQLPLSVCSGCMYSWGDIAAIKAALERIEAKMDDEQPQSLFGRSIGEVTTELREFTAQPASDDREHRALVMVLRALFLARDAMQHVNAFECETALEALTVARFMWPQAHEEAAEVAKKMQGGE